MRSRGWGVPGLDVFTTSGQETEWVYSKPLNPHGVIVREKIQKNYGVVIFYLFCVCYPPNVILWNLAYGWGFPDVISRTQFGNHWLSGSLWLNTRIIGAINLVSVIISLFSLIIILSYSLHFTPCVLLVITVKSKAISALNEQDVIHWWCGYRG